MPPFRSPPKILSQWLHQLPNRPLKRQAPVSRLFFYTFPSKSPVSEPPLHIPQQGPYGERSFISRVIGLFIHLYLSGSPIRSPPMKNGENIWSLSRVPHGWKVYLQWGAAWFPMGIVADTVILPQCHAACSTIPSTLAWVDQSPISQPVS